MSRLSDLKNRTRAFREIRSILNAMKNLSIAELGNLSRIRESQEEMARIVDEALEEVESSGIVRLPSALSGAPRFYLLFGSERGFCGDFNEAVLARYEREKALVPGPSKVLAIGRKIGLRLEGDATLAGILEGPGTTGEIPGIIEGLVPRLSEFSGNDWVFIHHQADDLPEKVLVLHPLRRAWERVEGKNAYPPLITLSTEELAAGLFEQFLLALLNRAFTLSFLAENRQRLQHMNGALDALDETLGELEKHGHELRQEEITEELEILLLGRGKRSGRGDHSESD